jgi:hypothetical protein
MHITESLISRVYYGFNQDTLFIRVDPKGSFDHLFKGLALSVQVIKPFPYKISVPFKKGPKAMLLSKKDQDWVEVKEIRDAAFGDIFECAIPFQDIEAKVHDELNLFISLQRGDDEIERCPWRGYITITVPTPDFDAMMWY